MKKILSVVVLLFAVVIMLGTAIKVFPQAPGPLTLKSIQRYNVVIDDTDRHGNTVKKILPKVSLIFNSAFYLEPAANLAYSIGIGDKAFFAGPGGNIVVVEMTRREFDQLKNGACIVFNGVPPGEMEARLKELYKNGEPKELAGAKCYRLNKTLIRKTPVSNRDDRVKQGRN